MAFISKWYTNYDMDVIKINSNWGVASITGELADISNWSRVTMYTKKGNYVCAMKRLVKPNQGIVLGGGADIVDFRFRSNAPIVGTEHIAYDYRTQAIGSTPYAYNTYFVGKYQNEEGTDFNSGVLSIYASGSPDGTINMYVDFYLYTQTPTNGKFADRTTWRYYTQSTDNNIISSGSNDASINSQFQCVRVYRATIQEKEYALIAIGVNSMSEIRPTGNGTQFLLIPIELFDDQPIKPYVGPVSKESAEAAYMGKRPKDSVLPRTLSNKNMLGFNANGVYLCKISESQYRQITSKIYNGFSGNIMNMLGQVVSFTVGGNDRRPYDEVQTMINGVICCHAVPNANRFPASGSVDLQSICGYSMFNAGEMTLTTINRFEQWTIESGIIPRPTGAFLDFAPFTTITLSIPVLGNVDLDASAILGNALKLYFTLDAFSGIIACDICIVESGAEWIYTTLHANCAVDMPIAGAGANANPLQKIAGGISSIFTGGAQNIPNAVIGIYDGVQNASYSRPISRVQSSNAMPIISPTVIYLTIATPDNYNAGDFWTLAGIPSHMSGNIGDFSGFTIFEHVDLSAVSGATESELQEIENVLYGGVWL